MRLYYQIFVSSRAATILRQRGADDRFSSSALLRADHQKRWSAPRSSEAATKPAPHYRDTAVCGEAALCRKTTATGRAEYVRVFCEMAYLAKAPGECAVGRFLTRDGISVDLELRLLYSARPTAGRRPDAG